MIRKNTQRNKFLFIHTISWIILLVFNTGCQDDILNFTPQTSISDESAYSTPEKIESQVLALYGQLSDPSFYGGRYLVFQEQRGNEFSQNDGNNSTGANVWNQSISSSGTFVNAVWTQAYRVINSANLLISRLDEVSFLGEEQKKNYVAEAKFIRALCYFSLVQTYARPFNQNKTTPALPLRLNPETNDANNDFAFSTVEDVYLQILADLNAAEQDLLESRSSALLNAARAHKATAIALKTRVYLVKRDYTKTIEEASKIVPANAPYSYSAGSVTHQLEANLNTLFNGKYLGSEAILSIPFSIATEAPDQQSALSANYLTPVLYLNLEGIVSDVIFSDPASTDARKGLIAVNANGLKLLKKFPTTTAPFLDYVPVVRYAEVLLNYAEAAAYSNDLSTATNLLYAVRRRSSPGFNFTSEQIDSQNALINTILNERRIELLGEGFRTPDLLRNLLSLPAKQGNAGTAPEILPTDVKYVWPIPSNELAYNKLAPR